MPANPEGAVFTYQTRVVVTPKQDQMLREYASLFGHVERTLFAEIQKGGDAKQRKSDYLARFGVTARQFNAVRIQLQGKINAIRELIPLQIEHLKTKIRKGKKNLAKLVKSIRGSNQLHQKQRRLVGLEQRLEKLEADQKTGQVHLCFGSKKLFHAQFHLPENGFDSHEDWHQTWTEARSRQFFILGSKDETAGCQSCVALPRRTAATRCECDCRARPRKSMCWSAEFALPTGTSSWRNLWPADGLYRIVSCATTRDGGCSFRRVSAPGHLFGPKPIDCSRHSRLRYV